jgi:hypothetical protein
VSSDARVQSVSWCVESLVSAESSSLSAAACCWRVLLALRAAVARGLAAALGLGAAAARAVAAAPPVGVRAELQLGAATFQEELQQYLVV